MTGKRRTDKSKSNGERKTRKLRLKKETVRDLDAKGGKGIKGGTLLYTGACRVGAQTLGANCGGGAHTLGAACGGKLQSYGCR